MSLDIDAIRREFPLLDRKTYLSSGSCGALSRRVEAAVNEYLASRFEYGAAWEPWVERQEVVRGLLARLLCCESADVSITSSLSASVNSLASSLDFHGARDTVVVTDFDFPTTSQIWLAQQRRGARVLRAAADESGVVIPLSAFDELIDERTALVSIPHVCYRNGVRLDVGPIVELAHARGAKVLLDGYQSIGTMPLDAPRTGADFVAGGCLKYLLGTSGTAFMYVRGSEDDAEVPTVTGWFAQEDIHAMDIYRNAPAHSARRFEAGTPNVCSLYAAAAGIELVLEVGLENIQARIDQLTNRIACDAIDRGWKLVTPAEPERHGALMAITSVDAPALVRALAGEGVVLTDRDGNIRISPHFYNNEADIEALFAALDRHAALVRKAG